MGRCSPHCALFRQHPVKDRKRALRQSCSELYTGAPIRDLVITARAQTSLLRALAPTTPTYVFPAMNTLMYEHPLTEQHLRIVREVIGYTVVGPIGKKLACGDIGEEHHSSRAVHHSFAHTCTSGIGAMTEWRDIVQIVVDKFSLKQKAVSQALKSELSPGVQI